MKPIKILPDHIANKIAAGEVVERPASVVKELVENALDSGATQIDVEIRGAGRGLIQITDDGSGMSFENAKLAFERHATSKISDLEDIYAIKTLGFRGEALPSIASIAEVDLITSEKKAAQGTHLKLEAGKEVVYEGAPPFEGTQIKVSNLFFNTPARRKFLKTDQTEINHIVSTFELTALAHAGVGFSLKNESKKVIDIPKNSDLLERIGLLFGKEFQAQMIPLHTEQSHLKVSGYVGKPSFSKSNRLSQYFFVNGRPIQNSHLSFALYQAYENLLMVHRYPVGVIFIEIDPSKVDVNIHPTKKEVRFYDEASVRHLFVIAVKQALSQSQFVPTIKKLKTEEKPFQKEKHLFESKSFASRLQESIISYSEKPKKNIESEEGTPALQQASSSAAWADPVQVLGVIKNTYLVCETIEGLLIIDQHAAHERLLFEKLMLDFQTGHTEMQQLLLPEMIELTAAEAALLEPFLQDLNKMGVSIATFGATSFVVDALPAFFKNQSAIELVKDLVGEIEEKGQTSESGQKKLAAMISCKAAVKAGDRLKPEEMKNLAMQTFLNLQNKTCPHGRPVMLQMSEDELAREFKRQ